jgi:hypothetical protein
MIRKALNFNEVDFYDPTRLCLPGGYFDPAAFNSKFRKYPWYPFEDFYFTMETIDNLISFGSKNQVTYRQTLPCRDGPCEMFMIEHPNSMDRHKIYDWLQYDEGIIYLDNGSIILNSFTDIVILSMGDDLAKCLFEDSVKSIFDQSKSMFKNENFPEEISFFMSAVRRTWELR